MDNALTLIFGLDIIIMIISAIIYHRKRGSKAIKTASFMLNILITTITIATGIIIINYIS